MEDNEALKEMGEEHSIVDEVVEKPQKPVNPNSFIPVIDDMYEIFGQIFLDNKTEIIKDNKEVFDCTLLGVLFSAGWGSPCRIFYKDLIEIYHKMNDGEKIFEIIQVSFDEKEEDFKKSIAGLPWKFLPLKFDGIQKLKERYNVLTIPKFFNFLEIVTKIQSTLHSNIALIPILNIKSSEKHVEFAKTIAASVHFCLIKSPL